MRLRVFHTGDFFGFLSSVFGIDADSPLGLLGPKPINLFMTRCPQSPFPFFAPALPPCGLCFFLKSMIRFCFVSRPCLMMRRGVPSPHSGRQCFPPPSLTDALLRSRMAKLLCFGLFLLGLCQSVDHPVSLPPESRSASWQEGAPPLSPGALLGTRPFPSPRHSCADYFFPPRRGCRCLLLKMRASSRFRSLQGLDIQTTLFLSFCTSARPVRTRTIRFQSPFYRVAELRSAMSHSFHEGVGLP